MTALQATVLLSLVLGQGAPRQQASQARTPANASSRLVMRTDRELDDVIDRFILSDIGRLQGRAALEAQQEFNRLDQQAVPALIRGLNRAANIRASCPIMVIGAKLNGLASFVEDREVVALALKTIGAGVTHPYHQGMLTTVRNNFQRRKMALVDGKLKERDQIARRLFAEDAEAAQKALKDERAEFRWAAARVAASKGLAFEADLIELLTDSDKEVRQEARTALVRLSRGLDFGPDRNPGEDDWTEAARRWRTWDEARRVGAELVRAPAERQQELLTQLKDGKGSAFTEVLAESIPQLSGDIAPLARTALVERLTRMTAKTLCAKLDAESRELRLGAIAACAAKKSKAVVPGLIPLLDDPDPEVALRVQAALKELTGKDFGPRRDVTRAEAISAWRDWWAGQGGE